MKKMLAAILLAMVLPACRYSKMPKTFTNGNVSIQYPAWLFKTDDIYPEKNTLLQLKNDYRDVYFILIDHGMKPGANGFDIMCDSVFNQLRRNIKEPNIEARDTIFSTTNNLKVKEIQISGVMSSKQQDHRFLFIIDVFESANGHIYQTAGWMLRHKREHWTKDIQHTAYSLKIKN
jgi:hypothetical protein